MNAVQRLTELNARLDEVIDFARGDYAIPFLAQKGQLNPGGDTESFLKYAMRKKLGRKIVADEVVNEAGHLVKNLKAMQHRTGGMENRAMRKGAASLIRTLRNEK